MLMDMIVEEEFEIKEDEPWYDKQDLEHDLQLAAELGKSLLERNRELEQGLGQMYSTNQEQGQEIEYLTKQVELLRHVNDQHAKVYEQLDSSARDLEHNNLKLISENRTAQNKIQGLTETVELLQTQVEELQKQVEDLKISSSLRSRQTGRPKGRQSISCLQELDYAFRLTSGDSDPSPVVCWHEEQREALTESLQVLQKQLSTERLRRERAEQHADVLANENAALEQQLGSVDAYKSRLMELEHESEELRQLWQLQSSARSALSNFSHDLDETLDSSKIPRLLKRSGSERTFSNKPNSHDPQDEHHHACSCIRRHDAFKYRGISLLNEVDAQYSALQVKYEELLSRSHDQSPDQDQNQDQNQNHQDDDKNHSMIVPNVANFDSFSDDLHQPEYKELFREIFQRIQKTKEDLGENRGGEVGEGGGGDRGGL